MKLPKAKDGSMFTPECSNANGVYRVGEKGNEIQFTDFDQALAYLLAMPVAKWRRANTKGNWGIVSAITWVDQEKTKNKVKKDVTTQNDLFDIGSVKEQIEWIEKATDLRDVNDLLTRVMAQQKIQPLIKDDNLSYIADMVADLALIGEGKEDENRLIASAILGRLSAVARGRGNEVFSRVNELLSKEPPGIEVLVDGDEKYYAALTFSQYNNKWLARYCIQQAYATDNAEKARKVLFATALEKSKTISDFVQLSSEGFDYLKDIKGVDARHKRIRRISSAMSEAIREWQGEVGAHAGIALGDWFYNLMRGGTKDADLSVVTTIFDDAISMVLRVIELRFSNALIAPTYKLLDKARTVIDKQHWSEVTRHSNNLERIRLCMKEAALVLASQDKMDSDLASVIASAFYSKAQATSAVSAHLADSHELNPDVKEWWENLGNVKKRVRNVEHKIGNGEDQQIGSLLINVETSKTVMEKLERAVVPMLEIQDPVLAATVKKAAQNYAEVAQSARQLARMRKLNHMGIKGEVMEYNPLQHEMLGGHQLGVRKVRVERDGIQKDFNGKIKILVKPRVTPADN